MATSRKVLFNHKVKVGSQFRIILLPDIYDNSSSTVGNVLGIQKLPETYTPAENDEDMTISEGMISGKLVRVRISYRDGTGSTAKRKSSRIICPIDKAPQAINSLIGKNFDGNKIIGAGFPRRRRLG